MRKIQKELLFTAAYFLSCAFLGAVLNAIYPLNNPTTITKPTFFPDKLFNTYMWSANWVKYAIALFLTSFSAITVYARINTDFGAVAFSRIPKEQIRKDYGHIFKYTIIPAIFTICYIKLFIETGF